MSSGNLYIISAPSGAGKTSLVKKLLTVVPQLSVSVSHTTRSIRSGEQSGRDYFFVSREDFLLMSVNQEFLEYAQVFDNYYGTAQQTVVNQLAAGDDVILEIDWQGAQQVKQKFPKSHSIFILPPSIEILEQRLRQRAQDSEETIQRRMRDAVAEMSHYHEFDYLVVNDVFEDALTELTSIILANRLTLAAQRVKLKGLLTSLLP